MPVYIMLSSLTAQGVQTLKSNPDRLREVNRDVEELGGESAPPVGDALAVRPRGTPSRCSDAATIARVLVPAGSRGEVLFQTLTRGARRLKEVKLSAMSSHDHCAMPTSR